MKHLLNSGIPKSSISPFWGTIIFGNHQLVHLKLLPKGTHLVIFAAAPGPEALIGDVSPAVDMWVTWALK